MNYSHLLSDNSGETLVQNEKKVNKLQKQELNAY